MASGVCPGQGVEVEVEIDLCDRRGPASHGGRYPDGVSGGDALSPVPGVAHGARWLLAWGQRPVRGRRATGEDMPHATRPTTQAPSPRPRGRAGPAFTLLAAALALSAHSPQPVVVEARAIEWASDVEAALERAKSEGRVVLLAVGEVGEGRSERHVDKLYGSRKLRAYLEGSVNIAAWSFRYEDEDDLPRFGDCTPRDHRDLMGAMKERWLRPNPDGVVALPQHLWLSPEGAVLLSCPWEIDLEEFAWCFDEALRRAGVEERPDPLDGAHPPRRLLLGEVLRVDKDDPLGRGLRLDELDPLLANMKRRTLTAEDGSDIRRIIFTDEPDGVEYLTEQFALWDVVGPSLGSIVDGTIHYVGLSAPVSFMPAIEQFADHPRASLRAQVAVGYEQFGHPDGLSTVKKALKAEKDDDVRAEWVRALGACGRGERTVGRTLARMAEKDDDERVRANAILALGHVLPEKGALEFLLEQVEEGGGEARQAAVLALALGRAQEARPALAKLAGSDADEDTLGFVGKALAVLDGGNLIELRDGFTQVSRSEIDRWRLFYWRGF